MIGITVAILISLFGSSHVVSLSVENCSYGSSDISCQSITSLSEINVTSKSLVHSLTVSDCSVREIDRNDLLGFNVTTVLRVTKCQLSIIGSSSFSGLKSLASLDLSWNNISTVTVEMFSDAPATLVNLSLAGNPIKVLPQRLFDELNWMQRIDLSHCQLTFIGEATFKSLHLQYINIASNNLTKLTRNVFDSVNATTELTISYNYWHCDCDLMWIRTFPIIGDAECFSPQSIAGQRVIDYQCIDCDCLDHDGSSSSHIVAAIVVPILLIFLVLICLCVFCRSRLQRSAEKRLSHRYSAVYRETVEQSAQAV